MERLIKVVNKLQDTFSQLKMECPIDLPQIAVVGGQSAGKSSVLENFVGKDFLPRGAGIVTRRPLVLQLINYNGVEYGEFLHTGNKQYTNFNEICKEIENETDRVTGSNKNISPLPINLRIYSPHVLSLTLVDLPGLTKIAVGDQPEDIGNQIRSMVTKFVSNPNCIILAVTPANIDLANSDALLLAKEVDPKGLRTIGVITKIDLMDKGTDCKDVLMNKTYPLKRGYVGVVNRSQADITGNKDIKLAQEAEVNYFITSAEYSDIADRCGTKHLQFVLHSELAQHIRLTLPTLKSKLVSNVTILQQKLKDLGEEDESYEQKSKLLMILIRKFSKSVEKTLGFDVEEADTKEISFGAKMNVILTKDFPLEMKAKKSSTAEIREDIIVALKNARGIRNTIFTPDAAFTTLIRRKINDLKPIAVKVVDKIIIELNGLIEEGIDTVGTKYPKLSDQIRSIVNSAVSECKDNAKLHACMLIEFEYAYINTKHPDFLSAIKIKDTEGSEPIEQGEDIQEEIAQSYDKTKQVLKRGFLKSSFEGGFRFKSSWFVLRGEGLYCYKNETEEKAKLMLPLSVTFVKVMKKATFVLGNVDNTPLLKDYTVLDFVCANQEECDDWVSLLLTRGSTLHKGSVVPKSQTPAITSSPATTRASNTQVSKPEDDMDEDDFKQLEMIRQYLEIYMQIVIKTLSDMVPKLVVHLIVNKLKEFLHGDIIAEIYSKFDIEDLLETSENTKKERQELSAIYRSCKDALDIIQDVANSAFDSSSELKGGNAKSPSREKSMLRPANAVKKRPMNAVKTNDIEI